MKNPKTPRITKACLEAFKNKYQVKWAEFVKARKIHERLERKFLQRNSPVSWAQYVESGKVHDRLYRRSVWASEAYLQAWLKAGKGVFAFYRQRHTKAVLRKTTISL